MSPSESSACKITFTTCPIARCSSSTSDREGDDSTAFSSSATIGRAAPAHPALSR
jgi:hypothetical protein